MRVVADLTTCLGNARCVVAAPEVFDVDDDGVVVVLDTNPSSDLAAKVELAVRSCPTGSLTLLPED